MLQFGKTKGITVNAVAPGPVATDIIAGAEGMEEVAKHFLEITRAGERIGTVDDIADSVLLLVSERSRWITGQYISVSGGMTGQ
jgi:NAD(P)-dependent dehydrogenase (short-subunit alcohol dehydrogenase family)